MIPVPFLLKSMLFRIGRLERNFFTDSDAGPAGCFRNRNAFGLVLVSPLNP
jgi:hypothetical protein